MGRPPGAEGRPPRGWDSGEMERNGRRSRAGIGRWEGPAEQRQEAGSEVGIVSCSVCLLYPPRVLRSRAQLVPGRLFVWS